MTQAAMARRRPNLFGGVLGFVWLILTIGPIYYVVITSLKKQSDYYDSNPLGIPTDPTLDAYRTVLQNDFLHYFVNSVIVAVVTVAVVVAISLMASYVIVRRSSAIARLSQRVFLLGIAIPIQATIVPVYYLIVQLHLYDTLPALILPGIAFAIPITVLILVNYLRDIPGELYDSMHADGAGDWRTFMSLVLPLSKPAITTVAVYDALNCWNGFLFPLILTQSEDKRTLPLSLWSYQGAFNSDIPAVLAAVVLSCLPILAAYIVGRRQLVAGLTAGFGK